MTMGETDVLTPEQVGRVKELAPGGRLDCAMAFKLAEEFGIPRSRMGNVLDGLGVRIRNCQLGCF